MSGDKPMERADFEQWKPKEVARLLALVETERRYYQEIVANVPVSLLIVGPDQKVLSANRHFRITAGKKNDDIHGKPLEEVFPVEGALDLSRHVISTGLASPRTESEWRVGTGDHVEDKKVLISGLPLRSWEEDSESEALLVIQDLIEPAVQAPVLTEAQSRALKLSNDVNAMLWEADLTQGKILHVNQAAQNLFGYSESDWLSKPDLWMERIDAEDQDRVRRFYEEISQLEGTNFTVEFRGLRADKSPFYARETVRVDRENGRAVRMVGITTDITERREMEEQSAASQKAEALHRLTAKLAHDLNNLLMIVAGYGEELKNSLPVSNPLHQDMKEILNATERLYSLTTQLQSYTRRPVVTAKNMSIPAVVEQLRPQLERAVGSRVRIDTHFPGQLEKARIDSEQLGAALQSLAHHAYLELGGEGIVKISADNVRIAESTGTDSGLSVGDYVKLSVYHNGTGMNRDSRQRILEPWLYSEDSIREIKMGLSAAYHIVRASGGDLTVDAAPGKGTIFHLYLPMISRADREAERAAAAMAAQTPVTVIPPPPVEAPADVATSLETILVVEDEGGIRALVRKILKRQGYQVLEASHGEEALQVMREHQGHIDLLLTDVMMPGMNGVDLSHKALAEKPHLRVLFVSGYTDESLLEAGQFPAGTAFLQKPFTLGSLLGKVREVLDTNAAKQAAS